MMKRVSTKLTTPRGIDVENRSNIPRVARAFVFLLALLALGLPAFAPVAGQSGRGQSPDKPRKPEKPKLPYPLPKIRLPENLPQSPKPKEEEDIIRISSDLVTIVATIAKKAVTDTIDLKQEDFEIIEDGVPQEVANFARDTDQPLNIVMLFDTSLSVAKRLEFERRAAGRFLERVLRQQDRAALFSVSTDVMLMQDFTNRVPQLVSAMKQLKPQGATSLYDAIYLASDYLKESAGRRVIILISDGGDTTSHKGLLDVLTKAQQSDVLIYSVYTGALNPSQNLRDLAAERALETLSAETGGEVFRAKTSDRDGEQDERSLRELDAAFSSLADQLRTQFVLGFFSSNEKKDGTYRRLNIHIKKPGYIVKSRAGYYAPKS
jgi:Ca-activated chloride channel family protein